MSIQARNLQHATNSTTLADLLERILDKGIVITGDIRINLVQVELLTIQIRLVVCSVDKAKEIGLDWWNQSPSLPNGAAEQSLLVDSMSRIEQRLLEVENRLKTATPALGRYADAAPLE